MESMTATTLGLNSPITQKKKALSFCIYQNNELGYVHFLW
jgi:hypothetical protein